METDTDLVLSQDAQDLLFRAARTTNAFTDEPVTDAQMRAIYDLTKWGPSSVNSQPLRVLLVRSDEARARLAALMGGGNRAKVEAAPLVALFAFDSQFHEHLDQQMPGIPGVRSWSEGGPDQGAAGGGA